MKFLAAILGMGLFGAAIGATPALADPWKGQYEQQKQELFRQHLERENAGDRQTEAIKRQIREQRADALRHARGHGAADIVRYYRDLEQSVQRQHEAREEQLRALYEQQKAALEAQYRGAQLHHYPGGYSTGYAPTYPGYGYGAYVPPAPVYPVHPTPQHRHHDTRWGFRIGPLSFDFK